MAPILILLLLPGVLTAPNLFKTPRFESLTDWSCSGCQCELSTDSHDGSHSVHITHRKRNWAGAQQSVTLESGQNYYVTAWVKILNLAPNKTTQDLIAKIDYIDNNDRHVYDTAGHTLFVTPGKWSLVGGDFSVPPNTKSVTFYVQIAQAEVNYLIDDAELIKIEPDSVADQDKRINSLRKANLDISVHGSSESVKVEVQQIKSEFGFGSAVNLRFLDKNKPYTDFFYDTFEWGVMENALKWPAVEHNVGTFYVLPVKHAVDSLLAKGIKLRGHNIFWGGPKVVPWWQRHMNGSQIRPLLPKHAQDMTSTFKGSFQHWDVENENLHLQFYEEKLKDPDITEWMFKEVKKLDPVTKLYLNDYGIVANKISTAAYRGQAEYLLSTGVPVEGMGIQSHLHGNLDLNLIKARLDEVAKAGLPIWITELDIDEVDEQKKAEKYEEVMKLYYSHPAVHGIMLWGYWDGRHWNPRAAICNGDNVTPNAAGRKIVELLKKTWRTNETHEIKHGGVIIIRAFKGSYKLLVHHKNHVIHTENFEVGSHGNTLKINLSGSGSEAKVDHIIIG